MFTPMTLALIGVAAAVLVVGGGFLYLRRRRPQEKDHVFYFNCPGCGHRLGYRKRQMGHSGPCPRCKRRITLPALPGK
jgi:LPXTG-motif cell wall-anchored protein